MAWSAQRRPAFFRSPYTTFLNTVRTTTIGKKKMHSPAFPVPVQLKRARAIKNNHSFIFVRDQGLREILPQAYS